MTSEHDDPAVWPVIKEIIAMSKNLPRLLYWGEIEGELEIQVSCEGIVLSKGYRKHGASLEHPWIEIGEAELRGLLSKGEELLRAIETEKSERVDGR